MKSRVVILAVVCLFFNFANAQTFFRAGVVNHAKDGTAVTEVKKQELMHRMEAVNAKIRCNGKVSESNMLYLRDLKNLVFQYEQLSRKESRNELKKPVI